MTYKGILELLQYIPKNSRHFDALTISDGDSYGYRQEEVELFATCYRDTAFRWHFVRSFVDIDEPLPEEVEDKYIKRLYKYLTGDHKDEYVMAAVSIAKNMPDMYQAGLKAMLLDPEATAEKISAIIGFEVPVVYIYEKLFFNVRDRLGEHAYIASIPYPDGRIGVVSAGEDYLRNPSEELMRVGYNNGMEQAAYALGLKNTVVTEDFANVAKKLENLFMSNALFLAQNGYMDTFHPGIQHAKQIIAAAKQGDSQDEVSEDIGAGAIGQTISLELQHYQELQSAKRSDMLKLEQQAKEDTTPAA